ncbi:MAG: hypothetical protein EA412_13740 [Chitinophagaceae bacterium]|nr:MAG: hypothetical protein EA412_13740 [Chitinophagaceae bacterium]
MFKKNSTIYFFLIAAFLSACTTTSEITDPNIAFDRKMYSIAAPLYVQEYREKEVPAQRAEAAFKAAESYRLANNSESAERWYERAIELDYRDPIVYYKYGQSLKANEKYQQAISAFEKYGREEPFSRGKANREIAASRNAMEWKRARQTIDVFNFEPLNSPYHEFAPVLYRRGALVFTSSRPDATGEDVYGWTGEQYMDIFISEKDRNGVFQEARQFSEITSSGFNDGTPAFNRDFTLMYFVRCGSQELITDYCYIYESRIGPNGEWMAPYRLDLFEDSVNTGTPFISNDGNMLIFSSDAPGGFGGKDLYYAYRTGTGWSNPINLGNEINTEGDELFPYVAPDGTLYFSSNGHPGMGGLDIFSAEPTGDSWTNVQNMKYPINSGGDDFGLIVDQAEPKGVNDPVRMSGYFTSARSGGKGGDDIYRFVKRNENLFVLEGIVKTAVYENPEDPSSEITGYEPIEGAEVQLRKIERTGQTDIGDSIVGEDGTFRFELEKETAYSVMGSKEGFFNRSETVTTRGKKDLENVTVTVYVELILDRIFRDREIVIPNIYYDFDASTLREESLAVLDTLSMMLEENPNIQLEIGSHTDSRGSVSYNQRLSLERARSVVRYLVENGIQQERLLAKGYGESNLVNHCKPGVECTEEEHQENRRTTFRVISDDFILESVQPSDIRVDPADR